MKEMVTEIEKLKMDLIATREKNGVFMSTDNYNVVSWSCVAHMQALTHDEGPCMLTGLSRACVLHGATGQDLQAV